MGKIAVPTKSNKTGKRVLRLPLEDKWVCAPANKRYSQSCRAIETEFKRNMHKPWEEYIEKMSQVIASYVESKCTSDEDRYRIIKLLAEGGLAEYAGRSQLGDIPGISDVEEEAWQTYMDAYRKLLKEREEALKRASYEHDVEKRKLWKEISDYYHHECHPEDDESNR